MNLIPKQLQGLISSPEQSIASPVMSPEAQKKSLMVQKQSLAVDNRPRPPLARRPAYPARGRSKLELGMIGLMIFCSLLFGAIIGSSILGGGLHGERNAINLNPFLLVVILVVAVLIGAVLGALVELGIWRWRVPEAFLFWKVRHGANILHRHVGTQGREIWRPGRLDPDGQYVEVQMGNMWVPVSVNPGIVGGNKTSYCGGMMIVDNVTNNIMPLSTLDEVSLYQLQEYYRDPLNGYKHLKYYKPGVVTYLYNLPPADLDQHCALHISVDPSIIDLPYLVKSGYIVPGEGEKIEDALKRLGKDTATKIVNAAYTDMCVAEKDNLKGDIIRLKEETRDWYIQDGAFLRYACADALDPRLASDAAETIKRIEMNKQNRPQPKPEFPMWIKAAIVFLACTAGIGIMVYMILMGVKSVMGG